MCLLLHTTYHCRFTYHFIEFHYHCIDHSNPLYTFYTYLYHLNFELSGGQPSLTSGSCTEKDDSSLLDQDLAKLLHILRASKRNAKAARSDIDVWWRMMTIPTYPGFWGEQSTVIMKSSSTVSTDLCCFHMPRGWDWKCWWSRVGLPCEAIMFQSSKGN